MRNIRIGKDILVRWRILTNGEDKPLAGRDLRLEIHDYYMNTRVLPFKLEDVNRIVTTVYGREQSVTGEHTFTLWENYGKEGQTVVDSCDGFNLVSTTCEEKDENNGLDTETVDLLTASIEMGISGKSAYESWLEQGNSGTEEDFIAWLRQPAVDAAESLSGVTEAAQTATQEAQSAARDAASSATLASGAASSATSAAGTANTAAQAANEAAAGIDGKIATKQDKTDNSLQTQDKTVVGAINELNENKAENNDVPTKLSQLENDAEFIKNTASNLVNYYLKSDTYTKSEVNALIGKIIPFTIKKVSELPETGQDNIIYLVPNTNGDENNIYDEYLWLDGKWEPIGTTRIDLSDYYTIEQVNEKFVEKIAGKSLSTNDYTNSDKEKVANAQPKEEGKGLSSNDYTNEDKQKVANMLTDAPKDGKNYGRNNGTWAEIESGNPDAVLYTEQELTDVQQGQARTNIGSAQIVKIENSGSGSIVKEIRPNVYYTFGEVTDLTLTLIQGQQDVLNEYMFEFVSGSTPTVLNEITGIEWLGDKIQSNRKYQASISNGIGILIGRNIS